MRKIYTLLMLCIMTTMGAWAEETKTLVYSNDFETSSDWTAKGKTDGWTCNPGTTTANTFASQVIGVGSGTGDMGLVSPSFTIGNDVEIVDVELNFKMDACTQGKSSGIEFITSDVNINNGYVSSGTPFFAIGASASSNGYWGTLTVGGEDCTTALNEAAITYENNSLNRNSTGIVTLNARFNFANGTATYSLTKGTTKVAEDVVVSFANLNATTLDRIFIHAGKTYGGVTIDDVKVYSVVTDEVVTTYRATFVETANLSPAITIYSDSEKSETITNGLLEDKTTYYYTALLEGYNDYEGSFTVNGADPTVNFTMEAKEQYTYNVYAVNSDNEPLSDTPIATVTAYAGVTSGLTWSKYVKINDKWYVTSETQFKTTVTESGTKNVVFDESDVTYFYEMESLTRSGGAYLTETAETYSNGSRLRLSKGSTYSTPALSGGTYELTIPWQNINGSAAEVYVYTKDANGNLSAVLATLEATGSTTNTFTTSIAVQEGYSIAFNGDEGSNNNNARMDYMTLKKTSEAPEQITIPENVKGFGTYVTTNALDFSGVEGLEAYIAEGENSSKVYVTKVDEVPAGTPIIVKGTSGVTYSVPVGTCTTEFTTNMLHGSATETHTVTLGEVVYAFNKTSGNLNLVNAGVVIPAKKAYFLSMFDGNDSNQAKEIAFFGEEETAVSSVNADVQKADARLFNAAGQQVTGAYKGLVIDENGNKYIK